MFGYFNYDSLLEDLDKGQWDVQYQQTKPFPHIVIDAAADSEKLSRVLARFPTPKDLSWWSYDNVFEKKLAFDKVHMLPIPIKEILLEFNSAPMINFLENLTGIKGLIPDPHYAGGGLHQITKGGKLGIHCDFNWNTRMELHRRINVILYLNKGWEDSYGGHLELWDSEMRECHHKVSPIFNRMVIFNTTDFSPHGHPDELTCPDGVTRKSIALYYYSASRPEHEISEKHSTQYKRRPNEETTAEIETLRALRAKGRVVDAST